MSDQLRHPGNELPEFVPSNRCPNPGGASGHRRLQSQLFDAAACLQTAVLNATAGSTGSRCSSFWTSRNIEAEVDGAETPEASNGNTQFCLRRDIHIFIAAIVFLVVAYVLTRCLA